LSLHPVRGRTGDKMLRGKRGRSEEGVSSERHIKNPAKVNKKKRKIT